MNLYIGSDFVEARWEPLSRHNRIKLDLTRPETGVAGSAEDLAKALSVSERNFFSENIVRRRGSKKRSINLEYIFWRISNDKYVKEQRNGTR